LENQDLSALLCVSSDQAFRAKRPWVPQFRRLISSSSCTCSGLCLSVQSDVFRTTGSRATRETSRNTPSNRVVAGLINNHEIENIWKMRQERVSRLQSTSKDNPKYTPVLEGECAIHVAAGRHLTRWSQGLLRHLPAEVGPHSWQPWTQ
jgi:hypothetical protein